jgi:urease accessory protein
MKTKVVDLGERDGNQRQLGGESGGRLLAFLGSLQLADSFFPSGLYTVSHGLEAYAQAGQLDVESLELIISDLLRYGAGPSDGIALANAHRASVGGDLDLAAQADRRLTGVKLAREPREASVRMGRQLLTLASQIFEDAFLTDYAALVRQKLVPGNQAIALGLAMAALDIPREDAVTGELYSFASSCAGAALRMSLIDHKQAQEVLHKLKPVIISVAQDSSRRGVSEIAGCTPLAEIMSMRHETAEIRLFAS